MSSSSNTASDIPVITDTMVSEYRHDTRSTQTITKDKLIDELVEHIEKQNRVIHQLKSELLDQRVTGAKATGPAELHRSNNRTEKPHTGRKLEKLSTRLLSKLNRNDRETTRQTAATGKQTSINHNALKAELAQQIKAELLAELKNDASQAEIPEPSPKPRSAPEKQKAQPQVLQKNAVPQRNTSRSAATAVPARSEPVKLAAVSRPNEPRKKAQWPFKFDAELERDEPDGDTVEDNEQLFSLTEKLNHHRPTYISTTQAPLALEITRVHRGSVKDQQHLMLGASYHAKVGDKSVKIANNSRKNVCHFYYSEQFFQAAVGDASTHTFDSTNATPLQAKPGNKRIRHRLPPDKVVYLKAGNDEYRLRSVPLTESPRVPETKTQNKTPFWRFFRYSLAFHFALLLVIGLYQAITQKPPKAVEEQRFAQVELPAPPAAKPEPTPPPTKPAEPKPEPKVVKNVKVTKKPTSPAPKPKQAGGGSKQGGNVKKRDVKQSGLLAALGTKRGKQPGSKQALATISSLDAVKSPNAQTATLSVGGLAAKVKGARIEVATGELIDTRGSTAVLRSGGAEGDGRIAALESGVTGNREVRGKVSATLSRKVKIQGGLSRDQVKRVIDAHMDEVVYCYEKTLLTTPDLAGKAVFEWKVLLSGRVGEVNIKSSNLRSNQIHTCINNAIKSWQFPQPSGTAVFVSFPFIFDSVEF